MKATLLYAALPLAAAGLLASCSSLDRPTTTSLNIIPKERAAALLAGAGIETQRGPAGSGALPAEASVAVRTAAALHPKDRHGYPTYTSERQRTRYVRTTAYSHLESDHGAYGRMNASGTPLKYGMVRSAAADWSRYPVGTTFKIKGLPYTYVVDDYGSGLVGTNTIDIYHPSMSGMRRWATRPAEITVIHWGSLERTANLLKARTKHRHCAQMYYAVTRKLAAPAYAGTSGSRRSAL